MAYSELPFKHFLITRFNLKSQHKSWVTDKNQTAVLNDEWMDHRIKLFREFCFPSVQKQTNKNFTWLIYLDYSTPEKYLNDLNKLFDSYPGPYKLCLSKSYDEFLAGYCNDVIELNRNLKDYIITTRFDNDDVAHKDFIGKIQYEFNFQSFTAINFVKIYTFDSLNKDKLFIDYLFSNHFISLIEKVHQGKIKGCYSKSDKQWNAGNDIIHIRKGTYCMELVHDKNLINDYHGFPVLSKTDLSGFQLQVVVKPNILDRNNFNFSKMSWKKYITYKIQSLCK